MAVTLNYNQTNQRGQITYHVVKTKQGWRIHDMETENWSLRDILHGKLENDQGAGAATGYEVTMSSAAYARALNAKEDSKVTCRTK